MDMREVVEFAIFKGIPYTARRFNMTETQVEDLLMQTDFPELEFVKKIKEVARTLRDEGESD
eukprot:CAMPEP_0201283276 /NCGR_PEP_ID=MMETSP1317-20130820/8130_1 /ASSEMBLY_ACC=CAM_ASM_000770 /TAXON_ID=187299 /ORGANISM="Undescribed Undescribed, Strain Undescribed" /LENGTH=61 /DNA_ID=CAMNT_0047598979 /DNA_START=250 /DNA_END=435 /DNA_ORIENTATION=+